jgi:hypothetical protein
VTKIENFKNPICLTRYFTKIEDLKNSNTCTSRISIGSSRYKLPSSTRLRFSQQSGVRITVYICIDVYVYCIYIHNQQNIMHSNKECSSGG